MCLIQIGYIVALTGHQVPADNAGGRVNFVLIFYFLSVLLRLLAAPYGLCLSPVHPLMNFLFDNHQVSQPEKGDAEWV